MAEAAKAPKTKPTVPALGTSASRTGAHEGAWLRSWLKFFQSGCAAATENSSQALAARHLLAMMTLKSRVSSYALPCIAYACLWYAAPLWLLCLVSQDA